MTEMGREQQNVQVDILESDGGNVIRLRDENGVFLECQPDESSGSGDERDPEDGGSSDGVREDGSSTEESRESRLEAELSQLGAENWALRSQMSELHGKLEDEKRKYRDMWRVSCEQLAEYDILITEKDGEIVSLRARVTELESHTPTVGHSPHTRHDSAHAETSTATSASVSVRVEPPLAPASSRLRVPTAHRRGKAPPVDSFDGENADIRFEDWLPTLQ